MKLTCAVAFFQRRSGSRQVRRNKTGFFKLDDKHYAACAYLLDAENVLRVDKPPLN